MSAIEAALALREEHIQQWMPYVAPRHRYWTRGEKKRIYAVILERDLAFVRHHLTHKDPLGRVTAAINILVYLTDSLILHNDTFRGILWRKIREFETDAHQQLVDTTDDTLRNHLYELLHILRFLEKSAQKWTF